MDMMLHERLREAEGIGDLQYIVGCESDEEYEIYTALANEIERYYIPRPRFEDWEPVQFGDKTGNLESVDIIEFRQDGTFQLGEKRKSGCGTYIGIYEAGELVKRPTPKIYDAEGVEIKVGDTVWHVRTGQKATVTTVYRDDQTLVEVEIVGHLMDYEPSDLTHREPDSLEKLRNDMMTTKFNDTEEKLNEWVDRLTSLIEMDA